jgi:hypothetical protein
MFKFNFNPAFHKHHVMLNVNGYAVEVSKLAQLSKQMTNKDAVIVLTAGQLDAELTAYLQGCRDIFNLGNFNVYVPAYTVRVKREQRSLTTAQSYAVSENAEHKWETRFPGMDKIRTMCEEFGIPFDADTWPASGKTLNYVGKFVNADDRASLKVDNDTVKITVPAQSFSSADKKMQVTLHSFFSDKAMTGKLTELAHGERVASKSDYVSYCSHPATIKGATVIGNYYGMIYSVKKVIRVGETIQKLAQFGGIGYDGLIELLRSKIDYAAPFNFDSIKAAITAVLRQLESNKFGNLNGLEVAQTIVNFNTACRKLYRHDKVELTAYLEALSTLRYGDNKAGLFGLLRDKRVIETIQYIKDNNKSLIDMTVNTSKFAPEEVLEYLLKTVNEYTF